MASIQVKLNRDVTPTGSDLSVVNAARRSFNSRSEWDLNSTLKDKDKRLIEFLARGMTADDFEQFKLEAGNKGLHWLYYMDNNKEAELVELLWQWRNTPTHDTPFNHTFISFEVKAPIFVARQLVKHEYLIFSEFSRRYITDDVEFYKPDYWRKAADNKKQGSLGEPVDYGVLTDFNAFCLYEFSTMLEEGVSPEQARMVLPQSTMTEWTWSGTLGAFAKMCRERLHPDAQYESRVVAKHVYNYLEMFYPVSAKALVKGPDV